jgi:hypothetical protein
VDSVLFLFFIFLNCESLHISFRGIPLEFRMLNSAEYRDYRWTSCTEFRGGNQGSGHGRPDGITKKDSQEGTARTGQPGKETMT